MAELCIMTWQTLKSIKVLVRGDPLQNQEAVKFMCFHSVYAKLSIGHKDDHACSGRFHGEGYVTPIVYLHLKLS